MSSEHTSVLVVEARGVDARPLIHNLQRLFPTTIKTTVAASLEDAERLRRQHEFDIVLADISIQQTGALRRMQNGAAVIAILDGELTQDLCNQMLAAGADFVLAKHDAVPASPSLWQSVLAFASNLKDERKRYQTKLGRLIQDLEAARCAGSR